MRRISGIVVGLAAVAAAAVVLAQDRTPPEEHGAMREVRLMTLDPGHFHASLVQKEMYPQVARRVDVYAPLGPDLLEHLGRIASFNRRPENPTAWEEEIHTSPDFMERMLRDRPGNVVVISGRNRGKIDRIAAIVHAGLNVLADKPWILRSADLPTLERALTEADERGLVAYDIMTERFEVTTAIQRELVNDETIFGARVPGTPEDPAVSLESIHYLMKVVAGSPLIRPPWFFDTSEQGEGLNDVGTHLVDLVQWTMFPDAAIDYRKDVEVTAAQRWPTMIPLAEFSRVTGEKTFPSSVNEHVKGDTLEYFCNTALWYRLRGLTVRLNVIWDWEAPPGSGDRHYASYRGGLSRVEVRQTKSDKYQPEVYVVSNDPGASARVMDAVQRRITALAGRFPGLTAEQRGTEIHVLIPERYRVGHEAHFAQVTRHFLEYLQDRRTLPAWERPNMIAKYYVTTTGTDMSHRSPVREAARIAPQ